MILKKVKENRVVANLKDIEGRIQNDISVVNSEVGPQINVKTKKEVIIN